MQFKKKYGKGDDEGVIHQKDTASTKLHGNDTEKQRDVADDIVLGVSNDTETNTTMEAKSTVLSDYPEIDVVVLELYDMFTKDPSIKLQIQIDRYLFAASFRFVQECGGDLETCVLHESQVPSIFNLPDIIYILRQRLIRGSWENSLQETVCRYTIPGMQKSRWVSRQRKPTSTNECMDRTSSKRAPTNTASNAEILNLDENDSSLASVYINTMFGLLLGLYPKCSKRPGFTMRVRITRAVRSLLSSSVNVQTRFILQHVSLVRLALVEYFANVLDLYCPVEYQLLQNHVAVDSYVNLCRSSCDLFRVNNLSEGMQTQEHNKPLDWVKLDQLAYKMTDKIIRSTRVETKLVNYVPVYHKSIKKVVSSNIYKQPKSRNDFLEIVKGCAIACWHDDQLFIPAYDRRIESWSEQR